MTRNSSVHPASGELTRLLETERQLAERLRAARAEAESVIVRARSDAEQREASLAAELDADQQRMAQRLIRERRKRERDIADDAQRQVSAYADVSDERLRAIARGLAHRLLDDESGP